MHLCFWLTMFACTAAVKGSALPELSVALGKHNQGRGLIIPSGGDGRNEAAVIDNQTVRRVTEDSGYLYVKIDHDDYKQGPIDLYVSAEVYDDDLKRINLTFDQFSRDLGRNTKYTAAEQAYFMTGEQCWRTLHFFLPDVRLGHGQNHNADFRFAAPGLAFRKIRVGSQRPADFNEQGGIDQQTLKNIAVHRKPGMELTFGSDATPAEAAMFRALSATSVESYVHWAGVEPERGRWDWSKWDQQVETLRRSDLQWVPFLIAGPAYATPLWFQNSSESAVFKCLEHNTESKVQSLFNPALPAQVKRFVQAFAERYRDTGIIESLLLGVTGIYGESIYPAGPQGGWTTRLTGEYHNHRGWWAGDRHAVHSFRTAIHKEYRKIRRLNAAWGTAYISFDEVTTFLPEDAPNLRARADFTEWYQQAMTDWSVFWVKTVRSAFPDTPIYLCTGGAGDPMLGADFTAQTAEIARYGAGVRITNEGSDYAHNFSRTREVATATRHYGTFCGFEPAAKINAVGIVARIYNATASGARQLHDYTANTFDKGLDSFQNFRVNAHRLIPRKPILSTAVYLSRESWALDNNAHSSCYELSRTLRDVTDFDYVTRRSLADGHLSGYKTLVLTHSPVLEPQSAEAIEKWVRKGGHLIAATIPGETLGGTLYDHQDWRMRLFSESRPAAPIMIPVIKSTIPERWQLQIGSKNDEEWLFGEWSHREEGGEWKEHKNATMRWSGAHPGVLLPVLPSTEHTVRLSLSVPPQALPADGVAVRINSRPVGQITKSGRQRCEFTIPAAIIGSRCIAELKLETKSWRPSEIDSHSSDQRNLGVSVHLVEIWRAGAQNKAVSNAELAFEPNPTTLRTLQCRIGSGKTTFLPGLTADERLIAALAAADYDGRIDRRYATHTADGILWFDASEARIFQVAPPDLTIGD